MYLDQNLVNEDLHYSYSTEPKMITPSERIVLNAEVEKRFKFNVFPSKTIKLNSEPTHKSHNTINSVKLALVTRLFREAKLSKDQYWGMINEKHEYYK